MDRSLIKINLQCADGVIGVELGRERAIGNQVVDATVANNRGSLGSGLLQAGVVGKVSMKDVDIGTVAQLFGHLFLGASLVADQTDDQVCRVFRDVLKEPELGCIRQESCETGRKANLHQFPWRRQ